MRFVRLTFIFGFIFLVLWGMCDRHEARTDSTRYSKKDIQAIEFQLISGQDPDLLIGMFGWFALALFAPAAGLLVTCIAQARRPTRRR